MILAIDVGNSNIVLGGLDKDKIHFISRIATDRQKTENEYAVIMRSIFHMNGVNADDFEGAIMSLVVPPLVTTLQNAVKSVIGKAPLLVEPGLKTGLNILIDNPAQLGADLVAGAVAAINKYPKPLVVIDMGTATTFSVVDKNNGFLGGFIFPGVRISHDALIARTSQLPHVPLEAPSKVICTNTVECMQSGLVYGNAAMIDSMVDRVEDELGSKVTVIATGGLARTIVPHCRREIICDDNLLLEGLRIIYEKNAKR
ncbi:MAG TPA: type III pantothenate kinase [Clostridiales bacterium]|jgi:type III pantothenate kinase|nr:type III pantothenate kinase [Clostridiales bacterium]